MTKGELWKGVSIRLIVALAFGAIGGYAIYYALSMVAIFGEGMGVDERSRTIYAQSHIVVHLFAAACALAMGVFYQGGHKVLRRLAIVAVLTCGGYGILNMVGFTSTNRVAVAAAKDAKNTAAERHYQNARADITKQIEWLQRTASQEEGRERRRMLAEVDAKRKELSALKPPAPSADTILPDAQASTLAEITHASAKKWQLWLPVMLAILVFFAESFSFVVVGHMVSGAIGLLVNHRANQTEPANQKNSGGSGGGSPGSGGSGGGEPRKKPELKPVPKTEPTPIRAEPSKQRSAFGVPATGAPEKLSAFDRAWEVYREHPHLSTRRIAYLAGVGQSTSQRVKSKARDASKSIVRKYGNGRGFHSPAYN